MLVEERSKTYGLGPGLITLAQAAKVGDVFAEIANGHVQDIAEAFGAKTTASVFSGKEHTIVVATSRDDADLQIHIPVGARVPMFSSAAGRVLVAFGA